MPVYIRTIEEDNSGKFTDVVNEHLSVGWKLHGNMCVSTRKDPCDPKYADYSVYSQMMVKEVEE